MTIVITAFERSPARGEARPAHQRAFVAQWAINDLEVDSR